MGRIVDRNQPCLSCTSHDARQVYEDGSSFCFSCRARFPAEGRRLRVPDAPEAPKQGSAAQLAEISTFEIRGFQERLIKKPVCEFFGVKASYNAAGEIDTHYYPYDGGTSYKVRTLPKAFRWVGHSDDLFGKERFSPSGKRVIVTEGEIDVLSIGQMSMDKWSKVYPVVGLSSAAMAEKSFMKNREWLRGFDEIVLCLDNDEAGKEATEKGIKILGVDKVKIAKLPEKDPNAVLVKHGSGTLLSCIYDATRYVPAGIIEKDALWKALEEYNSVESVPYPACLDGFNRKVKGMRGGEIALFVSGTGCGKSTLLREIILDVVTVHKKKVGIVSLEESPAESARKLAGMALNKNPAHEEIPLDVLKTGFDAVFGNNQIMLLDHQGSINDGSIVDQLEYMCLSGCEYLFIDHITILVSEGVDNLTGNEAQDKVMNDLLRLVKRYPNVWIGLVSHLRKVPNGKLSFEQGQLPTMDDIRGSGSVKQVSFDIFAFARDLTADDVSVRNSINAAVLKSRYTGLTGRVPGSRYIPETGRLIGLDKILVKNDEFTKL